jgi:hypothetical protein
MSFNLQEEKLNFSAVDVPPIKREAETSKISDTPTQKMGKKDIEVYEKKHQIDLKDFISRKGFLLLVYILIALFLLCLLDTIAINCGWKSSEHIITIIDFAKYTATMLLGFLFANQNSNKE